MNTNEIIQALILEGFKKLEHTDIDEWNQTQWTSAVLTPMCRIGKEQINCSVYAKSHFVDEQYNADGEWLYDVIWCEYEGDFLKSAPLVGECEWGNLGNIKGDFEKLILRAPLFVCSYSTGGTARMALERSLASSVTGSAHLKATKKGTPTCWLDMKAMKDPDVSGISTSL